MSHKAIKAWGVLSQAAPPAVEEGLVEIQAECLIDEFVEEPIVVLESETLSEDYYYEERELSAEVEVLADLYIEEPTIENEVVTTEEDLQNYYDEPLCELLAIIKSSINDAVAPVVKGRSPRPGETTAPLNQKVAFYVCGMMGDGVNIDEVKVKINAVEYKKGDPEFSYSGDPMQYFIEVGHPDWNYGQTVSVEINAKSLCGAQMTAELYNFTAEWQDSLTRKGVGNIELYQAADYSFDILTVEEDWVRQGVVRYTTELEVWWGRYQKLPYIENLEMMAQAGSTNAQGKEILDNGWLSVKVDGGSFVQVSADTKIDLGPMFPHSKKSLFFKLLVPETAATKKYFVLELKFEPQMYFPYGRFQHGKGIYSNAGNMVALMPNSHVYRAYVFDAAMWNQLVALGIVTSPFYRGEDHQW
jgi:hypothetical protein